MSRKYPGRLFPTIRLTLFSVAFHFFSNPAYILYPMLFTVYIHTTAAHFGKMMSKYPGDTAQNDDRYLPLLSRIESDKLHRYRYYHTYKAYIQTTRVRWRPHPKTADHSARLTERPPLYNITQFFLCFFRSRLKGHI